MTPNRREHSIAAEWLLLDLGKERNAEQVSHILAVHQAEQVARLLAAYRHELLQPFEELRRDFDALGDVRMARHLDELLKTSKGER